MDSRLRRATRSRSGALAQWYTFVVVVVVCSCLVLKSSSAAYSEAARVSVANDKGGVLSMLKLGFGSKFWSENVMGKVFDDWKVTEGTASFKEGLQNFTRAGTIAGYLKLSIVDAIHLPIPINFIFIGFDGEGNKGFKLGEDELERWFTNIDHILEHTRVPQLGEALTPFYRLKGTGQRQHHLPFVSYTHYNYSVHGIELDTKTSAVFERAVKLLSRKDNVSDGSDGTLWQVDVGGISQIFQSLVNYLQLENAYNVFVLNPKRDPSHERYGYRSGLSKSEIDFLMGHPDKRTELLKSNDKSHDFLANADKIKNPLYDRHPFSSFSWTSADEDSTASWVDSVDRELDVLEATLRLKSEEEVIMWRALQILKGKNIQLASALRKVLNPKETSGLLPECLVDAWVGQTRWSFIDLSAGPFTWGPAVGGDGVRTELSVPSVDASFNDLDISDSGVDTASVHQEFQNLWADRFTYIADDEQHEVDMLLAEVDLYEIFADKHCRGRRIALAFCEELDMRVQSVRLELQNLYEDGSGDGSKETNGHKQKAADLLKRIDEWNIFGFVNQHTQNYSVARDSFLAHLGSLLASSMKHVVTPSTADGAFHYYETIYFQVYLITEEELKDVRLLPLETNALKAALAELVLPSQQAIFGLHTIALSEDPALAMAFASSKRAAMVPMLLVNGTYKSGDRVYLDSLILQHHIRHLELETDKKVSGRSTIEVPIFWFFRSSGDSLLIDKHFQAKALPDMVFVVQSTNPAWESHLQCNGESILWDLRQPSKAAIAAVAEHLTGLLPSHITFSQAHENSIQNWLWSVGAHPFSSTSAGWHVSGFQNDAMSRSYIVTALDESIEVLNSAVEILANERTQEAAFSTFRSHELAIRHSYNQVINLWKRVAAYTEDLKYGDGLKLLSQLEISSQNFYAKVNSTVVVLHPVYCTRQGKLQTKMNLLAAGLAIMSVAILWFLLRPKHGKPKIN